MIMDSIKRSIFLSHIMNGWLQTEMNHKTNTDYFVVSLDFLFCLHYNNSPFYLGVFGINTVRDDKLIILNIEAMFFYAFL